MEAKVKKEVVGKKLSEKDIMEKLKEIKLARGKRTTDRMKTIEQLKNLFSHATTPYLILKIRTVLTSSLFEKTLNAVTFIPSKLWKDCYNSVIALLEVLSQNENVRLSENEHVEETFDEDGYPEESEPKTDETNGISKKKVEEEEKKDASGKELEKKEKKESQKQGVQYVEGNLFSFVQRLAAEYRKNLQNISYNTPEYINRLKDESILIDLLEKAHHYYKKINNDIFILQLVSIRLGLLYYHYNAEEDIQYEKYESPSQEEMHSFKQKSFGKNGKIIQELAAILYKQGNERQKVQTLLYHAYYLSIHGRYEEARDLLLMSHVQDNIDQADLPLRILFNRTMAQLGLCAFRHGDIENCLHVLCNFFVSNKARDLLAQVPRGLVRWNDKKDPKEEKRIRARQYPEHQHINLKLLEVVHIVSAMLMESSNVARHGGDKKHIISKKYRRIMENYKNQSFFVPPETDEEKIAAISIALKHGDWQKAFKYLEGMTSWNILQNKEIIIASLKKKIKEVALQTYLIYFGPHYKTIGVEYLLEMFELSETNVYRLCSELISNGLLHGAWDHTSNCIVTSGKQPTKLQLDGMQYINKTEAFLETNEKLLEQKFGSYRLGNDRRRGWTDFSSNRRNNYRNNNKRNNNYFSQKNRSNNRSNNRSTNNRYNRSGFSGGGFGARTKSAFGRRRNAWK